VFPGGFAGDRGALRSGAKSGEAERIRVKLAVQVALTGPALHRRIWLVLSANLPPRAPARLFCGRVRAAA